MGKVQFLFLRILSPVLTKFSLYEDDLALGYNSMNYTWHFRDISLFPKILNLKQLVYTMFTTNNQASIHLWWNENLVKHH